MRLIDGPVWVPILEVLNHLREFLMEILKFILC
jgi:hypothetical protein